MENKRLKIFFTILGFTFLFGIPAVSADIIPPILGDTLVQLTQLLSQAIWRRVMLFIMVFSILYVVAQGVGIFKKKDETVQKGPIIAVSIAISIIAVVGIPDNIVNIIFQLYSGIFALILLLGPMAGLLYMTYKKGANGNKVTSPMVHFARFLLFGLLWAALSSNVFGFLYNIQITAATSNSFSTHDVIGLLRLAAMIMTFVEFFRMFKLISFGATPANESGGALSSAVNFGKKVWNKAGEYDDKTKQKKLEKAKENYDALLDVQQVAEQLRNEGEKGAERLVNSAKTLHTVTSSNEFKSVINPEHFDLTLFRNPKLAEEAKGRYRLIINKLYEFISTMSQDSNLLSELCGKTKTAHPDNKQIHNAANALTASLKKVDSKLLRLTHLLNYGANTAIKKPELKIATDAKILKEISDLVKFILGHEGNESIMKLYDNLKKLLLNATKEISNTVEKESKESEESKSPDDKAFSNEELFKLIDNMEKDVERLRNIYENNKSNPKSKEKYKDGLTSIINTINHLLKNNSFVNPKEPNNLTVNLDKGNIYIEKLNKYINEFNTVFNKNKTVVPSQNDGTKLFINLLMEIFTKNPELAKKNTYFPVLNIVARNASKYLGNKIPTGKGVEGRISAAFGINIKPTENGGINNLFHKVVAEFNSGKS